MRTSMHHKWKCGWFAPLPPSSELKMQLLACVRLQFLLHFTRVDYFYVINGTPEILWTYSTLGILMVQRVLSNCFVMKLEEWQWSLRHTIAISNISASFIDLLAASWYKRMHYFTITIKFMFYRYELSSIGFNFCCMRKGVLRNLLIGV